MSDQKNSISISQIAKLANIPLEPGDETYFENSLNPVLEYMQSIGSISLENVAETTRTGEEENVLREDVVGSSFTQEEALQNTSQSYQGYFMVDAILDKEE